MALRAMSGKMNQPATEAAEIGRTIMNSIKILAATVGLTSLSFIALAITPLFA